MFSVPCPISSFYVFLCANGSLFCVAYVLLSYYYMLQIGGFLFNNGVCTGDWQAKCCRSWTCNMQDSVSYSQLPSLTVILSSCIALMLLYFFSDPASVVSVTVYLGLCTTLSPHRAYTVSRDLILLISGTFSLLTHFKPRPQLCFARLKTGQIGISALPMHRFLRHQCGLVCSADFHRASAEEQCNEAFVLHWHSNKSWLQPVEAVWG